MVLPSGNWHRSRGCKKTYKFVCGRGQISVRLLGMYSYYLSILRPLDFVLCTLSAFRSTQTHVDGITEAATNTIVQIGINRTIYIDARFREKHVINVQPDILREAVIDKHSPIRQPGEGEEHYNEHQCSKNL